MSTIHALDTDALYNVSCALSDVPDLVSAAGVSTAFRVAVEAVLRVRTTEQGYIHPGQIPRGFVTWILHLAWLEDINQQLYHTREFERGQALLLLGKRLDPSVLAGYAPVVVRTLNDNDWYVRTHALQTLRKLEPDILAKYAPDVVLQLSLTDHLGGNNHFVRCAALKTLSKLKQPALNLYATDIARQVDEIILDDADSVRKTALETLGQIGAAALASYVPVVVRRLHDEYWYVRLAALETLCKLELPVIAREKVATMMHEDHDADVRGAAGLLLQRQMASQQPPP
jgi:vesicle coat complex subunit